MTLTQNSTDERRTLPHEWLRWSPRASLRIGCGFAGLVPRRAAEGIIYPAGTRQCSHAPGGSLAGTNNEGDESNQSRRG